jgi:hypothetical protein
VLGLLEAEAVEKLMNLECDLCGGMHRGSCPPRSDPATRPEARRIAKLEAEVTRLKAALKEIRNSASEPHEDECGVAIDPPHDCFCSNCIATRALKENG